MNPPNHEFGPGREFSLIETLFDAAGGGAGRFSRDGRGLGDDGYLLDVGGQTWAVSKDLSVEGIHYRLDWCRPEEALEKAFLSNLSDINAMGGRTALAFLGLGALRAWDEKRIRALGRVVGRLEETFGFKVAGGDTVVKEKESFFSVTVMGPVTGKPLLRGGARPGHAVYVSGPLGCSAAGLALLRHGLRPGTLSADQKAALRAHLFPRPPLELGPFLSGLPGAGAAIDISDGLSSELSHLSRRSGCRLTVEWGKLPYDAALAALAGGIARPDASGAADSRAGDWRKWVLHGGEEYQLLFMGEFSGSELAEMGRIAPVREIGRVAEGEGVGILDEAGRESDLEAGGWSH